MDQVQKVLTKLFRGLGGSLSKRALALIEGGDLTALSALKRPDPRHYRTSARFARDYQVWASFSKLALPGNSEACFKAAVDKFLKSEQDCYHTNQFLQPYIIAVFENYFSEHVDMGLYDFICHARKKLKEFLGPLPRSLVPAFSQGSTLSHKGQLTTIADKISNPQTYYAGTKAIWDWAIKDSILDYAYTQRPVPMDCVRHNLFFTVPKNAKEDRGAAMEASLSLSLQLSIGKHLKKRFRSWTEVELKDMEVIQQGRARAGSLDQSIVTIDLSSASDSVTTGLVKLLLPDDWYTLLNSLRSTHTRIKLSKGTRDVYLNKFSTMGNGFTFELETLLFLLLGETLGIPRGEITVFGDDIIVPAKWSVPMQNMLKTFGFKINSEKTFCEGPFRESCGGDYFEGIGVRPAYFKTLPDGPQQWITWANALVEADPYLLRTKAAWRFIVDQLPVRLRRLGPVELGDGCLTAPAFETPEVYKVIDGIHLYQIIVPTGPKIKIDLYTPGVHMLAASLLNCPSELMPRGAETGYKVTAAPIRGVTPVLSDKVIYKLVHRLPLTDKEKQEYLNSTR